jgi:hypothetical protein
MLQTITIYCKILVIQEGQYSEIVVEDLNRDYTDDLKYVTVVKLPYWENPQFTMGDKGYLEFQSVKSGETQYFSRNEKDFEYYKYSNNYFIRFIKEKDLCKQKEFNF